MHVLQVRIGTRKNPLATKVPNAVQKVRHAGITPPSDDVFLPDKYSCSYERRQALILKFREYIILRVSNRLNLPWILYKE